MTATAMPLSLLLVHPPPTAVAKPPATLSQTMAFFSALISTPFMRQAPRQDAPDYAERLLAVMDQAGKNHHTVHCVCLSELNPLSLARLLNALQRRPSRLRLSLSCRIDTAKQAALSTRGDKNPIVQIQWRAMTRLPDSSFLRAFSRAGIWNHLILDAGAATTTNADAISRQPNLIHSWEMVGLGNQAAVSNDGYRQLTPLPGRPLWQAVNDPIQRFMLIDRFGRNWLLRSRVDDGGERLFLLGDALTYHFCTPDQLPDGYLDEICAMVAAGGTVATTHVRANLERAFLIAYVLEHGVIVGNSSLKNPRPAYIDTVLHQSGLNLSGFVERGYTSVRPEYRGLGIGTRLLAGLTARAGDHKIFSVIAEDNEATKIIARRNRTRQVATYYSEKAGKMVGIWMPVWMIDATENKRP